MILTELIKKLEELNNDSKNAVKPVKVSVHVFKHNDMNNNWTIDISKISLVDNHIEIE